MLGAWGLGLGFRVPGPGLSSAPPYAQCLSHSWRMSRLRGFRVKVFRGPTWRVGK